MSDIILVEDDKVQIKIITRMLESHGYNVIAYDNSSDALKYLSSTRPKLLILDLNLPDYNADELLIRFSQLKVWEDMSTILITASDLDNSATFKLASLGVERIFEKPINEEQFIKKIESVMKNEAHSA